MLLKSKKSQRAFRSHKPFWPELENELEWFVREQQATFGGLNSVQLQMKAVDIAKSMGIPNFKGGLSWCHRFLKRKKLSLRDMRTTLSKQLHADAQQVAFDSQQLPAYSVRLPVNWEEKIDTLCQIVTRQKENHSVESDNMDESPL
jgi:hypothetical protein